MSSYSAGDFEAEVNGPHPVWARIKFGDQELRGIRHDQLADLKHVLDRVIADAKRKLGKDASEVE